MTQRKDELTKDLLGTVFHVQTRYKRDGYQMSGQHPDTGMREEGDGCEMNEHHEEAVRRVS